MGIIISQIMFIPIWESEQGILIISIFLFSAILGIVYLVKLWRLNYKSKNSLKLTDWIKSIIISVVVIGGIPLLFFLSIMTTGQGFFGPTFIKEITLGDEKFFLYHNECFIPDGSCECNYYYSLVYRKNTHLPIMHLLTKVDFYADDIQLNKNELTISASKKCSSDINEVKKIKL